MLELGALIAGPFCTKILAEFGADVIKVEPPGSGDPLRKWRYLQDGTSVWWQVQSRGKRSVTIDLRKREGQAIVRDLAARADILVENFRPGTLEGWGLGYDALAAANPGLVMVRISGYGQDGPYSKRPGFGVIGEAMGGLRYVTGTPDRPPSRTGISIGDTLSALYGVIGAMIAIEQRHKTGRGQVVDVALYEAVFSVMESLLPEYDAFGAVRERSGSILPGIAPTSAYACSDGSHVLIAGNGDSIFQRLARVMGRDTTWPPTRHACAQRRPRGTPGVAGRRDRSVDIAPCARRRARGDGRGRRARIAHLLRARHRGRSALRRAGHDPRNPHWQGDAQGARGGTEVEHHAGRRGRWWPRTGRTYARRAGRTGLRHGSHHRRRCSPVAPSACRKPCCRETLTVPP